MKSLTKEQLDAITIMHSDSTLYDEWSILATKEDMMSLVAMARTSIVMREALVHTEEFCLCERNIEGFDYGQEHPKMGKARIGARWLIPSDVARTALRVANELMETKE